MFSEVILSGWCIGLGIKFLKGIENVRFELYVVVVFRVVRFFLFFISGIGFW